MRARLPSWHFAIGEFKLLNIIFQHTFLPGKTDVDWTACVFSYRLRFIHIFKWNLRKRLRNTFQRNLIEIPARSIDQNVMAWRTIKFSQFLKEEQVSLSKPWKTHWFLLLLQNFPSSAPQMKLSSSAPFGQHRSPLPSTTWLRFYRQFPNRLRFSPHIRACGCNVMTAALQNTPLLHAFIIFCELSEQGRCAVCRGFTNNLLWGPPTIIWRISAVLADECRVKRRISLCLRMHPRKYRKIQIHSEWDINRYQ